MHKYITLFNLQQNIFLHST